MAKSTKKTRTSSTPGTNEPTFDFFELIDCECSFLPSKNKLGLKNEKPESLTSAATSTSNSTAIQIFENPEFGKIRTKEINGELWFAGKDVAEILGYTDVAHAILDHVESEDRVNSKAQGQNDPEFGQRGTWLINESGLYSLILSSKLPKAREFKHWVTSEILPSVRKRGLYAMDELLDNPEFLINAFTELLEERKAKKKLEIEMACQQQKIAELQPKIDYYDSILQNKDLVPTTRVARDYGLSPMVFNRLLADLKIQHRTGKAWVLYQKYAKNGYTQSTTKIDEDGNTIMRTAWTQKGRLFLYQTLKENGIVPMVEREDEDSDEE